MITLDIWFFKGNFQLSELKKQTTKSASPLKTISWWFKNASVSVIQSHQVSRENFAFFLLWLSNNYGWTWKQITMNFIYIAFSFRVYQHLLIFLTHYHVLFASCTVQGNRNSSLFRIKLSVASRSTNQVCASLNPFSHLMS